MRGSVYFWGQPYNKETLRINDYYSLLQSEIVRITKGSKWVTDLVDKSLRLLVDNQAAIKH